jgi:hypothetical protein
MPNRASWIVSSHPYLWDYILVSQHGYTSYIGSSLCYRSQKTKKTPLNPQKSKSPQSATTKSPQSATKNTLKQLKVSKDQVTLEVSGEKN